MAAPVKEVWPQKGFQEKYLSSRADIAIGGGAAGAGKSFALLMENLRNVSNPNFGSVNFRRTMPQVRNEGGLWDTSKSVYNALPNALRPRALEHSAAWQFPSGAKVKFSHMQYEKDMYAWQGSQVPLIGFDELTHFLANQFWYMLTRNRSTSGVKPYVRCTTNPQGRGWVKDLIQWWIYPDDYPVNDMRGMPIPERDGVVRYVTRFKNRLLWGDNPEAVIIQLPGSEQQEYDVDSIKSLTFIAGTLADNPELTGKDPSYKANLLAQDESTAMQLLKGRWYSETDGDELYTYSCLRDMFTNFAPGGARYITADIAMEGSDLFVIFVWDGWKATHCYTFPKSDGRMVLEKIREISQRHAVPASNIAFDASGVGNFLRGWLRTAMDFRGGDTPEMDHGVKLKYKNFKAQCAYHFAGKVNGNEVLVAIPNEDLQERIVVEFDAHRKAPLDFQDRLGITSKDTIKSALGFSPDYYDALIMRSAFDLRKKTGKRRSSAV